MVTNQGINHILNVVFRGTTPITTWYLAPIDNAAFTTFAATDTHASHSGWSELGSGNYSNSVRATWTPAAPSSQAITNSTTADFNMTATCTVYGILISSSSTKNSTSGTDILMATAALTDGTQACRNGDVLRCVHTMAGTSS